MTDKNVNDFLGSLYQSLNGAVGVADVINRIGTTSYQILDNERKRGDSLRMAIQIDKQDELARQRSEREQKSINDYIAAYERTENAKMKNDRYVANTNAKALRDYGKYTGGKDVPVAPLTTPSTVAQTINNKSGSLYVNPDQGRSISDLVNRLRESRTKGLFDKSGKLSSDFIKDTWELQQYDESMRNNGGKDINVVDELTAAGNVIKAYQDKAWKDKDLFEYGRIVSYSPKLKGDFEEMLKSGVGENAEPWRKEAFKHWVNRDFSSYRQKASNSLINKSGLSDIKKQNIMEYYNDDYITKRYSNVGDYIESESLSSGLSFQNTKSTIGDLLSGFNGTIRELFKGKRYGE
jgi:hypothetical protein